MEQHMTNMTLFVAVIGALAFMVSVIIEVLKNVGVFKKIPTDIMVVVLAVVLTVTAYIAYIQYIQQVVIWYMVVAAILAGFIVAFIAMFGWEKVTELWERFYKE